MIKANPKTLLMRGSLVLSLKVVGLESHFSRGGSEQEQGCGGLGPGHLGEVTDELPSSGAS